ncbi:MAG TPA: GAF domain-containing protein [Ignavibacteria bacterium]|nr:GAF domain-containing protein [Ignavibacteriaceae bacterium]HRK00692.1 GAF domain-containing protein [Ignavibacteria bacterium]
MESAIIKLVKKAFFYNYTSSSISEILKEIVDFSKLDGAILWEKDPTIDNLVTVAYYFENDKYPIHNLSYKKSITGKSIETMKPFYIPDIHQNEEVYLNTRFWDDFKFNSFFTIPIEFKDGNQGALNLYSTVFDPLTQKKQELIAKVVKILPDLYQMTRDHLAFTLLIKIDEIFRTGLKGGSTPSKWDMKDVLSNVVEEIKNVFQCFETTIFLNDPYNNIDGFEMMATTWKTESGKTNYKADETDGLTGWVLKNRKPVSIPDLSVFKQQKEMIQRKYPNIIWLDTGDIRSAVIKSLNANLKNGQEIQPLSYIGIPITFGETLLGVIRCCAAMKSPYYFGTIELKILSLVATRIAQTCMNWIHLINKDKERKAWKDVVDCASELDLFVLNELKSETPDQNQIFEKVLEALNKLVSEAEIMDVRILDAQKKNLYFAAFFGESWNSGNEIGIKDRKSKTFPINGKSAGAEVFKTKKTLVLDPILKGDPYEPTFNQTKKIIVAPLLIGKEALGVLDVRSTNSKKFSSTAQPVIELMGRQLAVYYKLALSVLELKNVQDQQIQTFEDFSHQFNGPIIQASSWARLVVNESKNEKTDSIKHLNAISGLCNKARRVARNIDLFTNLARGFPLKVKLERVYSDQIIKLFKETASDNEIMISPDRNIFIKVYSEGFSILGKINLKLDINMLEQAVNSLLDNAAKYSYNNSEISLKGSLAGNGNFQVIVKNEGIPIFQDEVSNCKEREWRSQYAKSTTGEGRGIGLWVVDHIMKSHVIESNEISGKEISAVQRKNIGELMIIPTDQNNITLVKLIFPIARKS